jgi:hypothetical protein
LFITSVIFNRPGEFSFLSSVRRLPLNLSETIVILIKILSKVKLKRRIFLEFISISKHFYQSPRILISTRIAKIQSVIEDGFKTCVEHGGNQRPKIRKKSAWAICQIFPRLIFWFDSINLRKTAKKQTWLELVKNPRIWYISKKPIPWPLLSRSRMNLCSEL